MIAETPAPFRALKRLRLEAADGAALRLRSSGAVMEVQALASDVFRVRAVRGRVLGATASWAVVPPAWPAPTARQRLGNATARLATAEGRFHAAMRQNRRVLLELGAHAVEWPFAPRPDPARRGVWANAANRPAFSSRCAGVSFGFSRGNAGSTSPG